MNSLAYFSLEKLGFYIKTQHGCLNRFLSVICGVGPNCM